MVDLTAEKQILSDIADVLTKNTKEAKETRAAFNNVLEKQTENRLHADKVREDARIKREAEVKKDREKQLDAQMQLHLDGNATLGSVYKLQEQFEAEDKA